MIERNSLSQIVVARIDLKVSRTRRGWGYRYSRQHIRETGVVINGRTREEGWLLDALTRY